MSIEIGADISTQPALYTSDTETMSVDICAEQIYTPEASSASGVIYETDINIDAEIYVYNKANATLEDGVDIKISPNVVSNDGARASMSDGVDIFLSASALSGDGAQAGTTDIIDIYLDTNACAPEATKISNQSIINCDVVGCVNTPGITMLAANRPVNIGVSGNINTPNILMSHGQASTKFYITSTPEILPPTPISSDIQSSNLSMESEIYLPDASNAECLQNVALEIRAIVTTLDVVAFAAELKTMVYKEATLDEKDAWIYPEPMDDYLYIRQVCKIVTDK